MNHAPMPELQAQNLLPILLGQISPPELGRGPRPGVWPRAYVESLLEAHLPARSCPEEIRRPIEALVLLWHDHWEAAHQRVQGSETRDASFAHAIVHRREPDYWNSKYWWRRTGHHPCFPELARRVSAYLEAEADTVLAPQLLPGGEWDPLALVELCAAAADLPSADPRLARLRQIQRIETESALGHWLETAGR